MNYKVLTLKEKDEWDGYLNKLPEDQKDIYYSPDYYSLYENNGDGKAMCFLFKDEKDFALYPFLINSINKLGYELDDKYYDIQGAYGYNGVVSSSYDQKFIERFYNSFEKFCHDENIVAEFTRFNPILRNQKFSQDYHKVIKDRTTIKVNLKKSIDEIHNNFSSSTKRALKKAKKNRLHTRIFENSFPFKDDFIELYIETMNKVDSPKYLYFNQKYFNNLINLKNVIQILIEYNKIPIASSICFYSNKYFHYHLGASKGDYLNYRPNDLLFEEMIKIAKLKNCEVIHFGGGNSNKENDGLFNFKKCFSNEYEDFYIGKKIYKEGVYKNIENQWRTKHPYSYKNKHFKLLGYREI